MSGGRWNLVGALGLWLVVAVGGSALIQQGVRLWQPPGAHVVRLR